MTSSDYSHFPPDKHEGTYPAETASDIVHAPNPVLRQPMDETASVNLAQINADLTAGHDALREAFELHRKFCDLGI